jgi:multidrug resistance efflux pump
MPKTSPDDQSEYDRGVAAGQVLARLDSHDQHLSKINGSMDIVAHELKTLNMNVQRMNDAADADRAKAVVVADALDKADAARDKAAVRRWTPIERLIGMLFALVSLASLAAWLVVHVH